MKKSLILYFGIILMSRFSGSAQDNLKNGEALNIPFRKHGLSFGNSIEFNGIRFNIKDRNVKRINGLNFTFISKQNKDAIVNGINFGLVPKAASMQAINVGVLGIETISNMNGFNVGGIFMDVGAKGNINGVSLCGLYMAAGPQRKEVNSKISGFAVSGLAMIAQTEINGVALGGFLVLSNKNINGLALSAAIICAEKEYRGLAVTPGVQLANVYKGVAIASYSNTNNMQGLSIAIINRTKELHGVQLGLLNYSANNPRGLKLLPIINLHLRSQ